MVLRILGFGDPDKKGEEKARPAGSTARAAFGVFLRSRGEILRKEEKKGNNGALQPDGERHSVYRGQLRIEELEPKITP